MNENIIEKINESVDFILQKIKPLKPTIGIVLGSGLGEVADNIKNKIVLPYSDVLNMPRSTVAGHKGNFIFGTLEEKQVMVMQGRIHFYEGYTMQEVTFPIRVMQKLGIKFLILTSAVGGIKGKLPLKPADIVLVKDHINFLGDNPLRGVHFDEFGERFPDMSEVYDKNLREVAKKVATENKIKVYEGVYIACRGPSYETPAEIKAFKKLGADVVGMSVVPEAIVANQAKIKVLAIAYISNLAAGITKQALSHHEVLEIANVVANKITKLICGVVRKI